MPINVNYDLDAGLAGQAAYNTGLGQRAERISVRDAATAERERDRNINIQQVREQNALRVREQDMAQRRFEQSQAMEAQQAEAQRQQQLAMVDAQYQRQLILNYQLEQGHIDAVDYEYQSKRQQYTDQQRMEAQEIDGNIALVNADDTLTPVEREYALQQLKAKRYGITPTPISFAEDNSPWAPGKRQGEVWTDEATGVRMTRDNKGDVKVLSDAGAMDLPTLSKLYQSALDQFSTEVVGPDGKPTGQVIHDVEAAKRHVADVIALQKSLQGMAGRSTAQPFSGRQALRNEMGMPVQQLSDPAQGGAISQDQPLATGAAPQAMQQPDAQQPVPANQLTPEMFMARMGWDGQSQLDKVAFDRLYFYIYEQGGNIFSPQGRKMLELLNEDQARALARQLNSDGTLAAMKAGR